MRGGRTPIPCPQCGKPMTQIIDTRPRQHSVWRRRVCEDGHRATTLEQLTREQRHVVVESRPEPSI